MQDQIKNSPEVARADQIRVPIATLKEAARVLLEHVEELEGVVSLDEDKYWKICPSSWTTSSVSCRTSRSVSSRNV